MEQALADGMDVVNLSLGDTDWSDSPLVHTAERLVANGVVVVAAAGNEGEDGLFQMSSPAVAENVIAVASVENLVSEVFTLTSSHKPQKPFEFDYDEQQGEAFTTFADFDVATVSSTLVDNDACDPLPELSLSNKIALIRRGTCTFDVKVKHATDAGAKGVIIFNNVKHPMAAKVDITPEIVYGSCEMKDGERLFRAVRKAETGQASPVRVRVEKHQRPRRHNGKLSTFSSWGPSPRLEMKPDVAAPVSIFCRSFVYSCLMSFSREATLPR
jgi:subtilisin family serine protease